MAIKKIKLKIKENSTKAREAEFISNKSILNWDRSKIKTQTSESILKQNIYYVDANNISDDFERDSRRYINFQEVTL